jgi:hypothetical protein
MKKFFVAVLALVPLFAMRATTPIYVNDGFVTTPPQIDSRAFLNNGTIQIQTTDYFRTQNTLSYTNKGVMQGQPGFTFEFEDDFGKRSPALNFINSPGATVSVGPNFFLDGILKVHADNLVSRGLLSAPGDGVIQLVGEDVNLSRGGAVEIRAVNLGGGGIVYTNTVPPSPFGYFNDTGITDVYWGLGEIAVNLSDLIRIQVLPTRTNVTVNTPIFPVGPGGSDLISLNNPKSYILTNSLNVTNRLIQAIFIATHDTNITADASWAPSVDLSNPLNTAIVQFSTRSTNVITDNPIIESLTLWDDLASTTNRALLPNLGDIGAFRPLNYQLFNGALSGFIKSNAPLTSNLLTKWYSDVFTNGMDYTNNIITNCLFTAYAADKDALSLTLPPVAGASITNLSGRIDIVAKNLNIEATRMRAQGVVNIRAENLISSKGARIDSPFLYYDLGAANGFLKLEGLSQDNVRRFGGLSSGFGPGIRAWSALWTNYFENAETNAAAAAAGGRVAKAGRPRPQAPCPPGHDPVSSTLDGMPCDPDPGGGTDTNNPPATTTIRYEAIFHVLVVDCNLATVQPVGLAGLTTRSSSTEVADVMRITDSLQMLGESLTVNGELHLSGTLENWRGTNFPNLKFFTNNGLVAVPGAIHMGDDRVAPYESIVVRGTNIAYGQVMKTRNLEVSGRIQSYAGGVAITADSAKLDKGARIEATGDVILTAGDLKARGANIVTRPSGNLVIDVANSLTDAGVEEPNTFSARYGYTLARKPATGSLLGTTFEMNSVKFQEAVMSWAAEDRGAVAAGFTDNAAIGRLILASETGGFITLTGPDAKNGIYVDYVEISPNVLEDFENIVTISPNTTLYFASANVPIEELDGRLDGRIRWVSEFTGPNSSVDVLLSDGTVVTVNRGFRDSLTLDTDGDGIANGFDLTPFDGAVIGSIRVVNKPPLTTIITWSAAANTTYTVQYATSLNPSDWKDLTTVTNPNSGTASLSAEDLFQPNAPRYYRVVYNLNL